MIRLETLRTHKVPVQVLTGGDGPDLFYLHGAGLHVSSVYLLTGEGAKVRAAVAAVVEREGRLASAWMQGRKGALASTEPSISATPSACVVARPSSGIATVGPVSG